MKSCLNLFKALPIKDLTSCYPESKKIGSQALLKLTTERGFVFSPEVISNYSEGQLIEMVADLGLTAQQMNSSFHKSWNKIKTADIRQLLMEQIVHYITTYGFEAMGIYDVTSIYIPNETLEIPSLDGDIELVVIKGLTKEELKEKVMGMLTSGIALKEDTMNDVADVALFVELTEEEVEQIKNKEVKILMYEYLSLVPESPVEFLRYIVYKATQKTLLIKSKGVIQAIKDGDKIRIVKLFRDYEKAYTLKPLASIFYRFKPLFLALKDGTGSTPLRTFINRLRRLAYKHHRPMVPDYLNSVTGMLKRGDIVSYKEFEPALEVANTFRKIRLAYALNYRTREQESIMYRIRNGKAFATEFNFPKFQRKGAGEILKVVLDSIAKDIRPIVEGQTIYIPENINYALPATEKQFVGNLPTGSYVTVPQDMVAGIHWKNIGNHRIDLDLSLIAVNGGKIGWDDSYRREGYGGESVLFSGDMTDAQGEGASELFYVQRQMKEAFIMMLNYYNFDENIEVPFKIMIAREEVKNMGMNYMLDPNNIISVVDTKIDTKQKVLGLLITKPDEARFYFVETNMGNAITSSGKEYIEHSRRYLFSSSKNMISLEDVLQDAGAIITRSKIVVATEEFADIDLSLQALEKDTILNLIKG